MHVDTALLLLKLTAWCALPFAFRPLLARTSASLRHLLLTATLTGTLALPLLLVTAPAWHLPAWHAPAWLHALISKATSDVALEPVSQHKLIAPRADRLGLGGPSAAPGSRVEGNRMVMTSTPTTPGVALASIQQVQAVPAQLEQSQPSRSLTWPGMHWLGWIWLAGVIASASRTLVVARHARRIVRDASTACDPRALQAMVRAGQRLRLRSMPMLKQSRHTPVPFAWRGRDSVVVLPSCWSRWDDERLTVVLVHELAHLRRHDLPALWIGRAAVALWWFHPLVHALDRWARQECERAADDAVLRSGSLASEYAQHLLAISRALTRPFPAGVAPMMSNSPDLKQRLLAILSSDRPRRTLTRRLATGTSVAALACVVTLAGARLAPVAHAQEQDPNVDVKVEVQSDVDVEVDADAGRHRHRHHEGRRHDDGGGAGSRAGRADWKRASNAHGNGRYEEAIAAFEAAAAAGYRPAVATYNVACGLSLLGRTDEAMATLRQALDLGLDNPDLLAEDSDLDPLRADDRFQTLVDEAFALAGERRDPIEHYRYRNAHETLEVLRKTGSEDARAWSKAGTRLLTLRQLDEAAEALENAVRYANNAPSTTLYNLACAYALDDRRVDAFDALQRSIEAGYSHPKHMRRDPDLASLRDDSEFERLVELADALDLNRFRQAWRQEHGDTWYKGEQDPSNHVTLATEMWAPAIDHFRDLVDQNPDLGPGWYNLGFSLHLSERFDEAAQAFDRARELGYLPATSAYNAACGYAKQNQIEEALAALEQAIELGFKGRDLDNDSDLDNLRQDPRFRELQLKMQLDRDR